MCFINNMKKRQEKQVESLISSKKLFLRLKNTLNLGYNKSWIL